MAILKYKWDKQRVLTIAIHLLVICMLFFAPEMLMSYTHSDRWADYEWYIYSKALVFVAVFYAEYFILSRTVLRERRHPWALIMSNVLLIIVAMCIIYWLQHGYMTTHMMHRRHPLTHNDMLLRLSSFLLRDFGMVILTIALSVTMSIAENWARIAKEHAQMEASQREEELQSLKSQINPHFLFNTLNTIYSLIGIDQEQAKSAVHKLSHLLRYVLYENPSMVSLSNEIEFAESYISLMEMRLGKGAVKATFKAPDADRIMIAPLLFVTLIENAFKHGNTGDHSRPIEITITADTYGLVTCTTRNSFIIKEKKSGGIGIANLRRRLQLIYGNNADLNTRTEDDVFTASLTVNTAS